MQHALKELEKYLAAQYAALFGDRSWRFGTFGEHMKKPCITWHTSALDLLAEAENANGCGIFDPDIGLCLYFQIYDPKQPIREQVQQALSLRSKLQRRSNTKSAVVDDRGSWRVALHWFVEMQDLNAWISEAADLRERTLHFEEIPIDAIIGSSSDWPTAISKHGVPRLLFKLRSILRKRTKGEIDQWQNADAMVRDTLRDIVDEFSDPLTQQCARDVLRVSDSDLSRLNVETTFDGVTKQLKHIAIRNFRNIDELDITFRDDASAVSSTVIQGPNGSGKSSIFEALSLAVSGASLRYQAYFDDTHRRQFGSKDEYESKYLRNLSKEHEKPLLGLNGNSPSPIQFSTRHEIGLVMRELRGTFMSQDSGQAFISMSADELGTEIAASLSHLASSVRQYVDERLKSANEQLKTFNAKWNLRGNVTRRETVAIQIAERALQESIPNLTEHLVWLRNPMMSELIFANEVGAIADQIQALQGKSHELIRRFANGTESDVVRHAQPYHVGLSSIIASFAALYSQMTDLTGGWDRQDVERIRRHGEWLERASATGDLSRPEIQVLKDAERLVSEDLKRIVESGTELSNRLNHLSSIQSYVTLWSEHHPATCPTCDTDLGHRGVRGTIEALKSTLEHERSASRSLYQTRRGELEKIQLSLAERGVAPPPLTPDEEAQLEQRYSWLCRGDRPFAEFIGNRHDREHLIALIQHVNQAPALPVSRGSLDDWVAKLAGQVFSALEEHDKVSRLPTAWRDVEQVITAKLANVTAQHLPKTIQAVWQEIARNIMPARWQLPGDVELLAASSSRNTVASIIVRGSDRSVLANHILNGAEIHNLGLAWFITKYFLFGRFRYQFLVLDDPSDAMDQATFRDLCRFLETVIRLHVVEDMELSLVLLMHQEQRALDAARALNAMLYLLRWNKHTKAINRPMRVFGKTMGAPAPELQSA
ncbi:AAA family ATPase [Ferrovibrio sp.]|uniref:AAA family ATPase n=1 Tax=Ferrovibrio sp. TaxID=1917215 RepID=UPI0035AE54CA